MEKVNLKNKFDRISLKEGNINLKNMKEKENNIRNK